jgi:tight adherence protein B
MDSTQVIVLAAVGVGALLLVLLGVRRRKPLNTNEVIERMGRFATREDFLSVGDEGDGKRQPNQMARSLEDMVRGGTTAQRVSALLSRADVKVTVGEFILFRLVAAVGGFVLGFFVFARIAPALGLLLGLFTALIGYAIPVVYFNIKAKRRMKAFVGQLGDTITLMANSLRAGYSLLQTMEMVSREVKDPMGTEFRRVVREVGLGISNEDAMSNLLRRVPSDDLDLLVTAINIQHEVGGNLAQILNIIGHTIRERVRIKGEIGVLTAQQAISGYVITGLPVVLGVVIFLINPSYILGMFRWPYICMPIASVLMIIAGFFAMKKITAIEV